MNPVPSALIVIVHYGEVGITLRLLDSLTKLSKRDLLEVVIVNNNPRDSAESCLLQSLRSMPKVTCVEPQANRGYFGGAKAGVDYYRQLRGGLPPWIVVANNDIIVRDQSFLEKLFAHNLQNVGILAPRILSTRTKSDQNPFLRDRPSAARMHAYKWMYQSWVVLNAYELASAIFHRIRRGIRDLTGSPFGSDHRLGGKIYAPHGSFLIFSSQYFRAGDSLDFPCFLFGEEVYLAESLRTFGLDVVYDPSLEVVHQEHASTKLLKSRKLARFVASSAAYCADTYFPLKQAR